MYQIVSLPESRWKECRDFRLEALNKDPTAFGSSYDEEKHLSENEWRKRIHNSIFAMDNDIPVGMIVYVCQSALKSNHIANIFGFFVKKSHRGNDLGNRLVESTLQKLKESKKIRKVRLTVNSEQKIAINLYKKYGFKVAGTLKDELFHNRRYYDELIMELLF